MGSSFEPRIGYTVQLGQIIISMHSTKRLSYLVLTKICPGTMFVHIIELKTEKREGKDKHGQLQMWHRAYL